MGRVRAAGAQRSRRTRHNHQPEERNRDGSRQATPGGYLERPRPSGLADVIEVILDKGLVIDAYVRVSLIGIEILTIDARIVIASVDTYLRFAEAVGRLDIAEADDSQGLPELMESMTSGGAKSKTKGALEGVKEKLIAATTMTTTTSETSSSGAGRSQARSSSRRAAGRAASAEARPRSTSTASCRRPSRRACRTTGVDGLRCGRSSTPGWRRS